MRNLIAICLAAVCAAWLFTGCATGPRPAPIVSSNITTKDWETVAAELGRKMLDEFINKGELQSLDGAGQPSVLALSIVVNQTGRQLDTGILVNKLENVLIQTGKIIVDTTVGYGGVRDPAAADLYRKWVFEHGGKIRAPDYTLAGTISEDRQRAGSRGEVSYYFHFALTSSATGLAAWQGDVKITKQFTGSHVSY
jgi:PBP1b-binding outer membrane lipoprotein LpoB